jgi:hypothetical protein
MSTAQEIYNKANHALEYGKYRKGIKLFKQVLEMQPNLNALNGIVECYMGLEENETALEHARTLHEWAQKCGHKFMAGWAEAHIYTLETEVWHIFC